MDSFIADNQPSQARAAAEGLVLDVLHPGSQADAGKGAVFGVQHAGILAGAEAVDGSVFRLRDPASGQIPGRIPGGHPPVRVSTTSSRFVAAATRSRVVHAVKKRNHQEAQDLAMSAPRSVHKPATDVVEGVNVQVEIFDEDEGQGEEEEPEVVVIGPKRRKFISPVWMQFDRLKIGEKWMARCIHCSKKLRAETKNGTNHL